MFRLFHSSQANCPRVTQVLLPREGSQRLRVKRGEIQATSRQLYEAATTTQDCQQCGHPPGSRWRRGHPSELHCEEPIPTIICSSRQLLNHSRAVFLAQQQGRLGLRSHTPPQRDHTTTSTVLEPAAASLCGRPPRVTFSKRGQQQSPTNMFRPRSQQKSQRRQISCRPYGGKKVDGLPLAPTSPKLTNRLETPDKLFQFTLAMG